MEVGVVEVKLVVQWEVVKVVAEAAARAVALAVVDGLAAAELMGQSGVRKDLQRNRQNMQKS